MLPVPSSQSLRDKRDSELTGSTQGACGHAAGSSFGGEKAFRRSLFTRDGGRGRILATPVESSTIDRLNWWVMNNQLLP